MRVKLFTFRYSSTLGGFDDTPLVEFTRDRTVLDFREHFFQVNEVPHLSCVLIYQEPVMDRAVTRTSSDKTANAGNHRGTNSHKQQDPTAGLNEADRVLFNTLREWRTERAREEAVPPYVILTNRELLAIIDRRPDSPTALSHIDGLGPKKIERHGKAILGLLSGTTTRPPAAPVSSTATPSNSTTATRSA